MTGEEEAGAWVASLYAFRPVTNPEALRNVVEQACGECGLRGTVLIAPEGINVALAGRRPDIEGVIERCFPCVSARVQWSRAAAGNTVFGRLKVRVKPEIVTFDLALDAKTPVGKPVAPSDWNRLIEDPDTLTLDARNAFESARGTFRGARRVNTDSFREFRSYAGTLRRNGQRRIAMFCTGGIRCEKASALLLAQGFDEVYQLEGGILRYLAEVPDEESTFEGDCFVFDQREAVVRDDATGQVTEHGHGPRAELPSATGRTKESGPPIRS
ncbi:MAG: rhodanese-like domain-containing protein [Gammaproteobacteria bacterium]|nr:rhodanese-like domain-containing protein [Gammaproteobacteria bacterium]